MLITLKSKAVSNGVSSDESAANWTNHFREGIKFTPNSTVQLISCSISRNDDFLIEEGTNDRFTYAVGYTGQIQNPPGTDIGLGPFSQHTVILEPGAYTGYTLAEHIQSKLQDSVSLACFGPAGEGWTCTYTPAELDPRVNSKFEITWALLTGGGSWFPGEEGLYGETFPTQELFYPQAPVANWLNSAPTDPFAQLFQQPLTFNQIGGDSNIGIGGLILDGDKVQGFRIKEQGIYCDGGSIEANVDPVDIIESLTLTDGGTNRGELALENWFESGVTETGSIDNLGTVNGFQYLMTVPTGQDGIIKSLAVKAGANGYDGGLITDGGAGWTIGQTVFITSSTPGANGAVGTVTEVDEANADALVAFIITDPGDGFVFDSNTELLNTNGLGLNGDLNILGVLANFAGEGLIDGQVYTLQTGKLVDDTVLPVPAQIQIDTTGAGGSYNTSVIYNPGTDYEVGDFVYIDNGDDPATWLVVQEVDIELDVQFVHVGEEGAVGMSPWAFPHDINNLATLVPVSPNAFDSTTWDKGFKVGGDENFPNITVGGTASQDTRLFQINLNTATGPVGHLYGDTPNDPLADDGIIIMGIVSNLTARIPILFTKSYPSYSLGYTRQQFEPDNPFTEGYDAGTADLYVSVVSTEDNLDIFVEVRQLQIVSGDTVIKEMVPIFEGLISSITGLNWASGDIITMKIDVDNITRCGVSVGHDVQGDGVFQFAVIAESGLTPVADQLVPGRTLFQSNLRENHYPITPVFNYCLGTGFDADLPIGPSGGEISNKFFRQNSLNGITGGSISNGGNGYTVGMTGNLAAQGSDPGTGATYVVQTVSTGGVITSIAVYDPGRNYVGGNFVDLIPPVGSSAGGAADFVIFDTQQNNSARGAGYTAAQTYQTVALTGTGTGATVSVTGVDGTGAISGGVGIPDVGSGYVVGDQILVLKVAGVPETGMAVLQISGATPIVPGGGGVPTGMAAGFLFGLLDDPAFQFTTRGRNTIVTGAQTDDSLFTSDIVGAMEFPSFFKFSELVGLDINNTQFRDLVTDERRLWTGLVEPNTANLGRTLAMFPVYNYDTAAPFINGTIESNTLKEPESDITNPTIQIELPDFNVKSFSGASSDTGRAIAVIPREQFEADERTGVLHYESNYPVVIDLNCKDHIVLNSISARLRNLNGRLANIINPTQVTILIKDKPESSQAAALESAMERVEQRKADRQSEKIAVMNTGSIPFM